MPGSPRCGRIDLAGLCGTPFLADFEHQQGCLKTRFSFNSPLIHGCLWCYRTIVAVNKAWRDFARANGVAAQNYAVGASYLRACDSAAGAHSEEAAPFAEGIRSV